MIKWYRQVSILIVALILFSSVAIVFAQTVDYFNNWAKEEIEKWLSIGIIKTDEDGQFLPTGPITRVDMAILLNNIFQYKEKAENEFSDVAENMPFAEDVAKAVAAGNFKGYDSKFRPNDPISRQEAALVFSRAFGIPASDKNNLDKFIDSKNVESWSKDAVNAIVEYGYMQGKPDNLFAPDDAIERCEAVKIVDNIIEDLKNKAGTYSGTVNGNLVVNTRDVILKDMTVKGDLYLTEGIGDGEVKLENVKVAGRTIVSGGGENSIILNNTSISGSLIIIKKDGKIKVVATGNSEIGNIALNSGARLVESNLTGKGFGGVEVFRVAPGQQVFLEGDFDRLDIQADDVKVEIPDGTIGTLNILNSASGTGVTIGNTASITNLIANGEVNVTGGFRIKTAEIKSDGVVMDTRPENMDITKGVTTIIAGNSVTSTTPPVNPPSGGGTNPPSDPPTEAPVISFTASNRSVPAGETIESNVTVNPSDAVLSFSSGNTAVATVDAATGAITGIAAGSATITVTAAKAGYQSNTATFIADVCAKTQVGSLYASPRAATINTVKSVNLFYTPAERTNNQTVVFNLPEEMTATTGDKCYIASESEFVLSTENISNSGKTVTLKNLDLRIHACTLSLQNRTMPAATKTFSFNAASDSDGDLNYSTISSTTGASLEIVTTISDLRLYTLGADNISLIWTAPVGANSIALKYKKAGTADWNTPTNYYIDPILSKADISSLEPYIEYDFKLVVTGGDNEGDSNIYTNRTYKLPPTITADTTDNIIGNDITLTFDSSYDSNWSNSIYGISVSSNNKYNFYSKYSSEGIFSISDGSIIIDSSVFSGGGDYTIKVYASNYASTSAVQRIKGPISDFKSFSYSNDFIEFKFTAPGTTNVKIEQTTSGALSWTESTLGAPIAADATSARVTNLEAGTAYRFRLAVVGGDFEGNSNEVNAETLSHITSFVNTEVTSNSASFSFIAPAGATLVKMMQSTIGVDWVEAQLEASLDADSTSAKVIGLLPGKSYFFKIYVEGGYYAGNSYSRYVKTTAQ